MDEVLRLYREVTGQLYDGEVYGMDDLQENGDDDGNESDIDVPVKQFRDSDSENSDSDSGNEEDDDDRGSGNDGWSMTLSDIAVAPFESECGPTHDLDDSATPFDYLSLILTEEFYELAVRETNSYAEWRQENDGKSDSVWYPTSVAEMKLYINIIIIMGIHKLPEYFMYWSNDDRLRVPGVADTMSKNRYEKLSKYFHLNDRRTQPLRGEHNYDPLYKVRPMIDMVQTNSATCYKPQKDISFDEAMIAYHGRLAYKQYIKGKPNPWGIKVWCAAEAITGYLLRFSIYTGKVHDPMPHGMGYHVIQKLGEPFLHKHHHFFYDNYFSSIPLAEDLLRADTYCCSTVRANRKGWPQECSAAAGRRMKKGEIRFLQRGSLVAMGWKDKRYVTLLSTNTTPGMTTVKRRSPHGPVDVEVPSLIGTYNKSMGGVDRFDQSCSYYPVGRKSRKWWRYVFRFLLQAAIINSWIIYSASHRPKLKSKQLSQLDFRLSLSSSLTQGNITRKRKAPTQSPATAGTGSADMLDHRLIRMHGNKRACFWCSKNHIFVTRGRAHETVYGCSLCQIHLGKGDCFSRYHESLKQ